MSGGTWTVWGDGMGTLPSPGQGRRPHGAWVSGGNRCRSTGSWWEGQPLPQSFTLQRPQTLFLMVYVNPQQPQAPTPLIQCREGKPTSAGSLPLTSARVTALPALQPPAPVAVLARTLAEARRRWWLGQGQGQASYKARLPGLGWRGLPASSVRGVGSGGLWEEAEAVQWDPARV